MTIFSPSTLNKEYEILVLIAKATLAIKVQGVVVQANILALSTPIL